MENPNTSLSASLPLKEAYDDLVHPTAKAIGETISLIPRALNAALSPIYKWVESKEYNLEQTKQLLAEKLKNIPEDKIVPPDAYVAVPAIQNLSYCMDSTELRELYANLLANSLIAGKKEKVHPAFVDQIRQMSPLDARILENFSKPETLPLCSVKWTPDPNRFRGIKPLRHFKDNAGSSKALLENITVFSDLSASLEDLAVGISNLKRLGLLSIPEGRFLSNNDLYQPLDNSPKIHAYLLKYPPFTYLERKLGELTPLGKEFCKICITPPSAD